MYAMSGKRSFRITYAFIDRQHLPPILARVIRLIMMLCAIGLALAPVTAEAAVSAGSMPGCTMNKEMPVKPSSHAKMDCCTPACQVTAASALLPNSTGEETTSQPHAMTFAAGRVKELASISTTGLDPPPRA